MRADPEDLSNYETLVEMYWGAEANELAAHWAARAVDTFPARPEAWILKGSIAMRMSNFRYAIESYRHALELDPANSEALVGLANSQLLGGRTAEARATYEQGIKAFPKNARFYVGSADVLMQSAETIGPESAVEAQRLLQKAILLDDSLSAAHYLLGQLFLEQRRTKKAQVELELAQKLDPTSSRIHFALYRAYQRLGRTQSAIKQFALFEQYKDARASDVMSTHSNPASE